MRTERTEAERPRGVVIVSHGFGEHAGSYKETAGRLAAAGYSSVVFDQRGHGSLPEKDRGVVPGYMSFLDDIAAAISEEKKRAVPVILYGHSMGGNIVANYLLRRDPSGIACAVLESPWFGLYKGINPAVAWLAGAVGSVAPKAAIVNKLTFSDITGDQDRAAGYANDPLYHNRISFRLFSGINDACIYALKNASRWSVPTFLAVAKNERIVSNQATGKFRAAAGQSVTVKEYDSCHAIHNDAQRESFSADVTAFLDGFCPAALNA